jgi:hypothetical protein
MFVRHRAFHDGRVGPFVTFVDHIRSGRSSLGVWGSGETAPRRISSDRVVCGIGRQDRTGADDDG